MLKRILLTLALGAALVACSPSPGATTGTETLAPIDSALPSDAVPSEMPSDSAEPSAS
jgi:hypothetical protein